MRVIEVIKGFGVGGTELSLAHRLRYAPPDVSTNVMILVGDESAQEEALKDLASVKSLPRRATAAEVAARIEECRPDVVLIHNPAVAIRCVPLLARQDARVIIVAHNSRLSDFRSRDLALKLPMRRINAHAAGHIAVSRAAAEGPWCAGSRRVMVAPLGSEVAIPKGNYDSPWPAECRVRCLALGRLSHAKQVLKLASVVLGLADLFRSQGAHLAIVGSGAQEAAIRRKLRTAGVGDLISLHHATSTPGPYFLEADWLLVSSRYEGGPLTAYEAAIVGTGIAGTPVGILPDLLSNYPGGLMAAGCSSRHLRDLVERAVLVGPTSERARIARSEIGHCWQTANLTPKFYEAVRELTWGER